MAKPKEYKLYASVIQSVPKGIVYSFIAPRSKHLLVYADSVPQGDMPFVELQPTIKLNADEKNWLNSCKNQIEQLKEQAEQEETVKKFNEFLDCFKRELQTEQNNYKKQKGTT